MGKQEKKIIKLSNIYPWLCKNATFDDVYYFVIRLDDKAKK